MLDTSYNKGKKTELIFVLEAIKENYAVALPLTIEKYDLLIEKNGKVKKIQVKTATRMKENNTWRISLEQEKHLQTNGIKKKYYTKYTSEEVDFYAIYKEDDNSFFIIPFIENMKYITITEHLGHSKWDQYKNAWHLIG